MFTNRCILYLELWDSMRIKGTKKKKDFVVYVLLDNVFC